MEQFSSTNAKQQFGRLMRAAAAGPVAIERHGAVQAIVAAPEFFQPAERPHDVAAGRRLARLNQQLTDQQRLIRHQRIALDLLTLPAKDSRAMVASARAVVQRWRDDRLCSPDYIERWSHILDLPPAQMAQRLSSDADGWGPALRQNSPWVGVRV